MNPTLLERFRAINPKIESVSVNHTLTDVQVIARVNGQFPYVWISGTSATACIDEALSHVEQKTHQTGLYAKVDMTGTSCLQCNTGTYQETSLHDDIDGVLHCTTCRASTNRYIPARTLA